MNKKLILLGLILVFSCAYKKGSSEIPVEGTQSPAKKNPETPAQNPDHRNQNYSLNATAKEYIELLGFPKSADEVTLQLTAVKEKVKTIIDEVIKTPRPNFANTFKKLDTAYAIIINDIDYFAVIGFTTPDVKLKPALLAASSEMEILKSKLYSNPELFAALKVATEKPGFSNRLSAESKELVSRTMREFHRAGIDAPEDVRAELAQNQEALSKLSEDFGEALGQAQLQISKYSSEEILAMPKFIQDMAAKYNKNGTYEVPDGATTLLGPIISYSNDAAVRERAWRAANGSSKELALKYVTQAANLRKARAQLLGYPSWAAYKTEVGMTKNPSRVEKMYEDIVPKIQITQKREQARLLEMKKNLAGGADVELFPWDFAYLERTIREKEYDVDEEKIREYFPMQKVIQGTFEVYGKLFGIEFKKYEGAFEKWQSDVELYIVTDTRTGKLLGGIYLDLLARPETKKRAGAWNATLRTPLKIGGKILRITGQVVANFRPKVGDAKDSYLSFVEMRTFFHEFGHGVHSLTGNVYTAKLGMDGTSRDYVECPSQFMEEFLEDYKIVSKLSAHKDTGAAIPEELFKKVIDSLYITRAEGILRQVALGQIDMKLYNRPTASAELTDPEVLKISDETFQGLTVNYPTGIGYVSGFAHIISNDYDAAYYGYLWSKIYAADCADKFRQSPEGFMNPRLGMKWRKDVLTKNGAVDPNVLLEKFLGRPMTMESFLKPFN